MPRIEKLVDVLVENDFSYMYLLYDTSYFRWSKERPPGKRYFRHTKRKTERFRIVHINLKKSSTTSMGGSVEEWGELRSVLKPPLLADTGHPQEHQKSGLK